MPTAPGSGYERRLRGEWWTAHRGEPIAVARATPVTPAIRPLAEGRPVTVGQIAATSGVSPAEVERRPRHCSSAESTSRPRERQSGDRTRVLDRSCDHPKHTCSTLRDRQLPGLVALPGILNGAGARRPEHRLRPHVPISPASCGRTPVRRRGCRRRRWVGRVT
jgi:hypothetical protein